MERMRAMLQVGESAPLFTLTTYTGVKGIMISYPSGMMFVR